VNGPAVTRHVTTRGNFGQMERESLRRSTARERLLTARQGKVPPRQRNSGQMARAKESSSLRQGKLAAVSDPSGPAVIRHVTARYERTLLFIDAIHIDDDKRL